MEIEEVKTRRKKREELLEEETTKNLFEFSIGRIVGAAGDVNVCPWIKRPLIVCFQAVIENIFSFRCPISRMRPVCSNYCPGQCNTQADKEVLM